MMTPKEPFSAEPEYDAASAISIGGRDCQEDAIITDFPQGAGLGLVVLADGMGGHAAGDVASKIVVTEVFSELKLRSGNRACFERNIRQILCDAAQVANECVLAHATTHPGTTGMGATLLASVLIGDRLHWLSVGDSPLLLYRDGRIRRLNEDHSLAPQIDHMVRSGLIPPERGRNHPDRNCLTSVLIGLEIPRIDCPVQPLRMRRGDVVIAATDGLEFLSDDEIEAVLLDHDEAPSAEIAAALMARIETLADPWQDNVTLAVVRPGPAPAGGRAATGNGAAVRSGPAPLPEMAAVMHRSAAAGDVSVVASGSSSGVAMMCRFPNPAGRGG